MADGTKIEWADATVNTVYGCSKASPGCQNCYAIQQTRRLISLGHKGLEDTLAFEYGGGGDHAGTVDWSGHVIVHADATKRMDKVLHWQKPRVIFVNSMADTFHVDVPWAHQMQWFVTAALAPQHRFLFLTKRPENMADFVMDDVTRHCIEVEWERRAEGINWDKNKHLGLEDNPGQLRPFQWPLPNVWLGFTAEDQVRFDQRWAQMYPLATLGWNTFASMEPLLGPVDPSMALMGFISTDGGPEIDHLLKWVIVGGESGPKARPMHPDWVRQIVADCQAAGVPVMFKQWGEWRPATADECHSGNMVTVWNQIDHPWLNEAKQIPQPKTTCVHWGAHCYRGMVEQPDHYGWQVPVLKLGKRSTGRLIDGAEVLEWPKGVRDV